MKKLTAGIFATLLTMVSVDGAYAAIASKGYVDEQVDTVEATVATKADKATTLSGYGITDAYTSDQGTALEGRVSAVEAPKAQVAADVTGPVSGGTVYTAIQGVSGDVTGVTSDVADLKKDMTQAQTDISGLKEASATHATKGELTSGLAGKQDKLSQTGSASQPVYVNAEGNVVAGTAYGSLATKSTVTSAEITDGTIAEGDLNESINASLDKADTALQKAAADAAYAAKSTETVASSASTNAQKALTDIGTKSELTTTNKDNLVGAINELDAAMEGMATNDTIQGIQTDLTELKGKVDTNTTNIETNTTHIGTVGSLSTNAKGDLVSAVNEVKTQADKGVSDAAAAQSAAEAAQSTATQAQTTASAALPKATYDDQVGTVSASNMGTTATTVVTAIKEVKTQADKGVSDAATAKSVADAAQDAADAAIPKPSGECSDPANKCVLTFNNSAYAWEVIARDGEGE